MKTVIGIMVFLGAVNLRGMAIDRIMQSLPKALSGWQAEAADERYDRATLYHYIDGGAELYLTYDFQQVVVRRYVQQQAPEIVLEIYDMNCSHDAYGIFSAERQDEEVGIGQDSEYGGGLLRFWKDKYFIAIQAIGDVPMAKPTIIDLGHRVAAAIPASGERPDLLPLVPPENLVNNSIRFFHDHTILNRQYFLASENILNLNRQTDCVFAPYQVGAGKSYLLLIRYPDKPPAETAYLSFLANYLPDALGTGFAQMENGTWAMVRSAGRHLIIVFDAPTQQWAADLISSVTKLLP